MKMLSRRTLLAAALPALCPSSGTGPRGQEPGEYPTHPVTFVVPFARGGGTDSLARLFGDKLAGAVQSSPSRCRTVRGKAR